MKNIVLLRHCISHPDDFLDEHYMFVEKDKKLDIFVNNIKELKELLITIKQLKIKKAHTKILDDFYKKLRRCIASKKVNYSEFGCFVNACDSNDKEISLDIDLLKRITNLYLKKRELNEIVPSEWVQAIIDKGSSRKKGHAGEKKLSDLLRAHGYVEVNSIGEFKKTKKCFSRFKKSGDFSLANINHVFGLNLGREKQGKMLDLVVKKRRDVYFLEAKHMNTGGGGQDKQIVELVDIIRIHPPENSYHFVAFLDGIYFNKIFLEGPVKNGTGKKGSQRDDIRLALSAVPNNYFINTSGFKRLFSK